MKRYKIVEKKKKIFVKRKIFVVIAGSGCSMTIYLTVLSQFLFIKGFKTALHEQQSYRKNVKYLKDMKY